MGAVLAVRLADEGLKGTLEALPSDPAVNYLTPNRKWVDMRFSAVTETSTNQGVGQ